MNHVKKARVFLFRGIHDNISKPGAVENVDGLLAQMMNTPGKDIKREISTLAFGHEVPLKTTPFVGSNIAVGYDGPRECLQHVYEMMPGELKGGNATKNNWMTFDQAEFSGHKPIGFQNMGWVYVPQRCHPVIQNVVKNTEGGTGSAPCKLVVRPGKCTPPAMDVAPDVAEFANYAQANGIVLLSPCLGGPVDKSFKFAKDIEAGRLDVYGQLDSNYVQQSAPHMRAIGKMIRRVLGIVEPVFPNGPNPPNPPSPPTPPFNCSEPPVACTHSMNTSLDGGKLCCGCKNAMGKLHAPDQAWAGSCPVACQAAPQMCAAILECPGVCPAPAPGAYKIIKMPTLKINRTGILTAGCSNTADFSEQFHVAFSSIVTGSCIFSGMPYHSAVTRFPNDYMVAKSRSTAAGIHCVGCDANGTLTYDHAKNHPQFVDLDMLHAYAENPPVGHIIDDPKVHLANARTFAFGPTHDRCYQPPAMENIANFKLRYAKNPEQVKLVENQPFPHTLPDNDTAYYNDDNNHTGAGYDGPGECVSHVFGHGKRLYPLAKSEKASIAKYWLRVNVSEFVLEKDRQQAMTDSAWLFVPPRCNTGMCKLIVLPGGCDAFFGTPPGGGSDDDFARYGFVNGFIVLKPCQTGKIDRTVYPDNHENFRGMVDVYGQLSPLYATQKGGQMEPTGKMIKRLIGMPGFEGNGLTM